MNLKGLLLTAGLLTAAPALSEPVSIDWGIQTQLGAGKKVEHLDFETGLQLHFNFPYGLRATGDIGVRLEQGLPESGSPVFGMGGAIEKEFGIYSAGFQARQYSSSRQGYRTHPSTGEGRIIEENKDLNLIGPFFTRRLNSEDSKVRADLTLSLSRVTGEFTETTVFGEYKTENLEDYKATLGLRLSW